MGFFLQQKQNQQPYGVEVVHQRSSVVVKLKSSRPIAPRPGVEGYEVLLPGGRWVKVVAAPHTEIQL